MIDLRILLCLLSLFVWVCPVEGTAYDRQGEGLTSITAADIPAGTTELNYRDNSISDLEPLRAWLQVCHVYYIYMYCGITPH